MTRNDVILRDMAAGDAEWIIRQHAVHYAESDGFDASFGVLVADVVDNFIRNHDPKVDRAWIAVADGQRLGSIFCGSESGDVARLRLFFLVPEARGRGVGRRLLTTCVEHARSKGFRYLRLWTHESHHAACALYRASGFDLIDSRPVHSFGQDMVEQIWQLAL